MTVGDPRAQRRESEPETDRSLVAEHETPFRRDLERIRFSPYFSRLSSVTQVIGQTGAGPLVHNRLTHSLKVASVARTIAVDVCDLIAQQPELPPEYACDPVVVQAAASAHDLGHPPFGHLGELVLDRLARDTLGLADGFEGNAQTYRIVSVLDVCNGPLQGLNLTAATRAAIAKYPWTAGVTRDDFGEHALPPGIRARGAGGAGGSRSAGAASEDRDGAQHGGLDVRKISAYFLEAEDLSEARAVSHGLIPFQQSLEASVMDIADDIAYSVHDIDDFHRVGVLGHGAVSREFRAWLDGAAAFAAAAPEDLVSRRPPAGSALEGLRRKLHADDPWIADDDAFREAVLTVADDLVDGLLADDFDGSIASERALASFTSRWLRHLRGSVVLAPRDNLRTGLVTLDRRAWHEVAVLKFVHRHFVLGRPDITMYQRGLQRLLVRVVKGLRAWLDDRDDQAHLPPRLRELVEIATDGYLALRRNPPEGMPEIEAGHEVRLGRARGVLDYVASLPDDRAIAVSEAIDGRPDRLWGVGQQL